MNNLISIIIPIYKVEKYLEKCIDSVINQTYHNLEIILVDDGSPDNCGKICDEYSLKDNRIKVIHKQNGGLSDARNAGLDIMTGDFVGFVDSDDWIEPTMYEMLLKLIYEYDVDIAVGGVSDDVEKNGKVESVKVSDYGAIPFKESNIDAMKRYFYGSWSAWDKLYKAELFSEIRYPVGEINEDEAIVLKLLHQCEHVCYTSEVFYHYMKHENSMSITTSDFSVKKLVWKKHCLENYWYICNYYPTLEQDALFRYRTSVLWSLTELALNVETMDLKSEIKGLKAELYCNKNKFMSLPFNYKSDYYRIRLFYLCGFSCFSKLLRIIRRVRR